MAQISSENIARDSNFEYDSHGFPMHYYSNEEKNSRWVLAFIKAIYAHWNHYRGNGTTIFSNQARFYENRTYAGGWQNQNVYKNRYEVGEGPEGESETMLNIDWSIVPILTKYANLAKAMMEKQLTNIVATPLDPVSQNAKRKFKYSQIASIVYKDFLDEMEQMAGIKKDYEDDLMPQTVEEVDLFMETGGYKTQLAISMEKAIRLILQLNNFEFRVKRSVIADLVECGIGAIIDYVDSNGFIKVERIKPEDLVVGWAENDDFFNAQYKGRFRYYSIEELRQRAGDNFTEEQYVDIEKNHTGYLDSHGVWRDLPYSSYFGNTDITHRWVKVFEGYFFSHNTIQAKKRETKYGYDIYEKVPETWKVPENNPKVTAKRTNYRVVYQGSWIVGSNYIFDAGLMPNQSRQRNNLYDTQLPIHAVAYNQYLMNNRSLVEQIKPWADIAQNAWLQFQNLLAKIIPPGVVVDQRWLEGVSDGLGGFTKPSELLKTFKQTGDIVLNSYDEMTGVSQYNMSAKPHSGAISEALPQIMEIIMFSSQMMERIIGFNEATSSATPNPKALVGLQQYQMAGTHNAMWYITSALDRMIENMAYDLCGKIQTVASTGTKIEGWLEAIGKTDVEMFRITSDLDVGSFGIKVENRMTEAERQQLERYIEIQLNIRVQSGGVGGIELEDAIAIREMPNMKMAMRMLLVRRKRRQREDAQRQAEIQEREIQKVQTAGQMEMEKIQAQSNLELQAKMQEIAAENEAKLSQMDKERTTELEKIEEKVRGDLDAIVRKALFDLDKERVKGEEARKTEKVKANQNSGQ